MCRFYEICPSKVGWCTCHGPCEDCVKLILTQYEHLRIRFIETMKEEV